MFKKLFIDHPHQGGETYLQHLGFTARTTIELFCIGAALIIHGLLPFLFETTASRGIKRLNEIVTARAQHARTLSEPSRKSAAHAFENILL
ncbi:MAG: DUF6356 family protein [Alphaproteobacteria bacterium]